MEKGRPKNLFESLADSLKAIHVHSSFDGYGGRKVMAGTSEKSHRLLFEYPKIIFMALRRRGTMGWFGGTKKSSV